MVTKLKKSSILKIHIAYSSNDLFSLYYEPWHVRKPGIFIIRGIFRLKSSMVLRSMSDIM